MCPQQQHGPSSDKSPSEPRTEQSSSTGGKVTPAGPTEQPGAKTGSSSSTDELTQLRLYVRTLGHGLMLMVRSITVGPDLYQLLGSVYGLLQQGENAISTVLDDVEKGTPVQIPPPEVANLPAWPSNLQNAPSVMEDVWGILQPWMGKLVAQLPGSSPGEQALKLWAVNCMANWQTLAKSIERIVAG